MTAVLQELVHIVRQAGNFNANAQVVPAALLWTDRESQWLPALPQLLQAVPELFVFGAYDPGRRTGPAIWLRCVIAGTLEEVEVPEGKVPVIYLPGVPVTVRRVPYSRGDLADPGPVRLLAGARHPARVGGAAQSVECE